MTGKKIVSNSELINNIFIRFPPAVAGCAHSCSSRTVVTRLYSIKVRWWKLCSAHDKDSKCDLLYFCVFLLHFLLASRRRFVFQTEISGNYIVLVLISLLFYFFSSLRRFRRGDESTVFCIVSTCGRHRWAYLTYVCGDWLIKDMAPYWEFYLLPLHSEWR